MLNWGKDRVPASMPTPLLSDDKFLRLLSALEYILLLFFLQILLLLSFIYLLIYSTLLKDIQGQC